MVKSEDEEETYISQNNSESRSFNLLKADNELYKDEDNLPQTVVSAKRLKLPRSGEDWEILVNGKIALLLKGTRFSNSEKVFLRTVEGMKFLISEYKNGFKSVVKIKEDLKKIL